MFISVLLRLYRKCTYSIIFQTLLEAKELHNKGREQKEEHEKSNTEDSALEASQGPLTAHKDD